MPAGRRDRERAPTTIAPWILVPSAADALAFYKEAFGVVDIERHDAPDGELQVAQLWIGGADFWIQTDPSTSPGTQADPPVRMILSVDDPDAVFARAVAAGALVVNPIYEGHGWRIGRIVDPFGHHWEIGRPLDS
jgi:PhnB protein